MTRRAAAAEALPLSTSRQRQRLDEQHLEQSEPAGGTEQRVAGGERARPVGPGVAPVVEHVDLDQAVGLVEADRFTRAGGEPRKRDVLAQRVTYARENRRRDRAGRDGRACTVRSP